MSARMRARWASTEVSWSAIRRLRAVAQHRAGLDPLGGLGAQLDVADDLDPGAEGPVARDPERGGPAHRRGTLGEPLVELTDQLVEVAVEVHERQRLGDLVEHEVLAEVVDVAAQDQ